ncbi:S1 family peptidase [Streptomyces atratus]|uniref:S1 family peptidase n=1 Tax=Streptomyces atratus TaxID=1893 RepID=UPI003F53EAA6
MHPGYAQSEDGTPNRNDLALVRLDRPVAQKPVRIAKQAGPVGTPTRILGFGTAVEGDYPEKWVFPERLRQLDTSRGSEAECFDRAGSTRLCTVSLKPGAMACNGDSGGPQLQRARNGRWELIGTTSGNGDPDPTCSTGPGLYTNVPVYSHWIRKTVHPSGRPPVGGQVPGPGVNPGTAPAVPSGDRPTARGTLSGAPPVRPRVSTSRWRRTMSRSFGLRMSRSAGVGRPGRHDQTRSNRSRFITLSHAATKSFTNFSFASSLA